MLVVARYLDGRLVKGSTTDFHPERDHFHVTSPTGESTEKVSTQGMKALFFVRSLDGDRTREDNRQFPEWNGKVRDRVWLRFRDGEGMAAWPVSPDRRGRGFYVLPTDPGSNVEKAYVWHESLAEVVDGIEAFWVAEEEAERRRREEAEAGIRRIMD